MFLDVLSNLIESSFGNKLEQQQFTGLAVCMAALS